MLNLLIVVTSSLDLLWSYTSLVVKIGASVGEFPGSVVSVRGLLEIVFHEFNVLLVLLFLGSGVPKDQNAVLVKTVSHLLALLFPPGEAVQVDVHIDYGHLFE